MRVTPRYMALLLLLAAAPAAAQPTVTQQADASQRVALEVGQTRLMRVSEKIVRVSVADPNVADVRVVTPLQVLVTAKGVGYTHLILWGDSDKPLVIAVSCTRNLNQLRTQLGELFPKEQIKVSSAGDLVVLSGEVSDVRLPARVAEVAKLHSERLANLVQVSGNQQVQLEVRFAEVSRTGMRKMGVNMLYSDPANGRVGAIVGAGGQSGQVIPYLQIPGTGVPAPGAMVPPVVPAPVHGEAFNMLFSANLDKFPFSAILSILAEEGLAKILAEPTLVALSGQDASFHAGGEVPIVFSQQFGTVSVQFKKFGVRLKFTPTVLGQRTMNLKLYAEVSEPDPTAGVTIAGFSIPGFKTRTSETTIRLKDGQSFAVAGLLSDKIRSAVRKIPLLGDIPLLGALFRSTAFQREETELMVVVTTHLVQPMQPHEVPMLPGEDDLNDPDDFQFFLLGRTSGWKRKASRSKPDEALRSGGGPVGQLGFIRD
ncbi:MAG: type II and III secretion system protein family protein [Deltaproteobacteria bacterium]|nr:type II and III secretion system protein family protein [Deltaproteobacteria bacterium]